MFVFDNKHIFTGYLKQYLNSFHLPNYRVYTKENYDYHQEHLYEKENEKDIFRTIVKNSDGKIYHENTKYIEYIKDGYVQYCVQQPDGHINWIRYENRPFAYNKLDLNHTRNLVLNSNVYDSYTHEYLGDFLRFQRDYNNIDLMSLYNCFNNRLVSHLKLNFTKVNYETDFSLNDDPQRTVNIQKSSELVSFDTTDSHYKIYMIPVRLFKKYTIAIDSPNVIEMCCGIFGNYLDTRDKFIPLSPSTYLKLNTMNFNQPIVFDKLLSENLNTEVLRTYGSKNYIDTELALMEKDLKLFLKVPSDLTSSIVILEGDYTGWNDYSFKKRTGNNNYVFTQNKYVTNYENFSDNSKFTPISRLQLLSLNTKISYPFADKLVEYFLGNVIHDKDEIHDNVKRVETVLRLNNNPIEMDEHGSPLGLWRNRYQRAVYDKITDLASIEYQKENSKQYDLSSILLDTLGYVDKYAEKYYTHKSKNEDGEVITTSISGVDIYSEE